MKRFKQLIQAMPLDEQAFTSKRNTWERFIAEESKISNLIKRIFDGKDAVQISRKNLFAFAKAEDLECFIIATILWGYPRGMRGNHFQNLMSQMEALKVALTEAKAGVSNWEDHSKKIEKINGLGLSTYSKFLYFLEADIEGYKALILDNRITNTISKKLFKEFESMRSVRYDNAISKYPQYLKIVDNISNKLDADSGKVEMFIFEFGQNLKLV